jgi:hypothetical protein
MTCKAEAPRFSVYLGSGLYIAGVVFYGCEKNNEVGIQGSSDGSALTIARAENARQYFRAAAVHVCHVARRSGLSAWLVSSPVVSI